MIILFRSCEANLSPGSMGEGTENKPRWNGKYKLEILRKCYLSLQHSLDDRDKIIIVNDRTTHATLDWMKANTKAQFQVKNITPLDELRQTHPYPTYHPVIVNACTDLMDFLVAVAQENPDELIYICEDDYLHLPEAIPAMKSLFFNSKYSGFYAPYDYPDRYTIDSNKEATILLHKYGHLRTIPSATLTIAALGKTWLQFKYELLRAGVFADDSWTWKAFKQVGALCPLPGHATHLQDGCITPIINWGVVYDKINC